MDERSAVGDGPCSNLILRCGLTGPGMTVVRQLLFVRSARIRWWAIELPSSWLEGRSWRGAVLVPVGAVLNAPLRSV